MIVKGGAAIEGLGAARTVLLDKTGTLTLGVPSVERVMAFDGVGREEVLQLGASVDQLSSHVLAAAIVRQAGQEAIPLLRPRAVREEPGQGIEGLVDSRRVVLGSRAWLAENGIRDDGEPSLPSASEGRAVVLLAVDGHLAGAFLMADHLRPDAPVLIRRLRAAGVMQVGMISGDRQEVAEAVGRRLGLDRVYGEQSPEQKLEIVRSMQGDPRCAPVVMVGDGINDAPALAIADVGIAISGPSATVSSETADAVITVDRIDRVADAVSIGRRTVRIARQSVLFGIGLSVFGMGLAAAGWLVPVAGAIFQEAIDVAVILNALRALGEGRETAGPVPPGPGEPA